MAVPANVLLRWRLYNLTFAFINLFPSIPGFAGRSGYDLASYNNKYSKYLLFSPADSEKPCCCHCVATGLLVVALLPCSGSLANQQPGGFAA